MKKYLVLGLAALLLTAVVSPETALAGGRGKGGGGGAVSSTGSLSVSPATVDAWGGQYLVTGSGFYPGQVVNFSVAQPGCCIAFNIWADSNGNVSFTRTTGEPGTYKIDAYQTNGRKLVLMGTVSFEVVGP